VEIVILISEEREVDFEVLPELTSVRWNFLV
jgi:hypothetical protein